MDRFQKHLILALKRKVSIAARRSIPKSLSRIRAFVEMDLMQQDFIQSLNGGILMADFGLTEAMASKFSRQLIEFISRSIKLEYVAGNAASLGSLRCIFDFDIPTEEFSYISEKSGSRINWLHWLLYSGSQVVVADFEVEYGQFSSSRSGFAVMKSGGMFRVAPQFAGFAESNVLYRWMEKAHLVIFDIMVEEFLHFFSA